MSEVHREHRSAAVGKKAIGPLVLLTLFNAAAMIVLFGFELVEDAFQVYKALLKQANLKLGGQAEDVLFGLLLAPLMLPLAVFVLIPIVAMRMGKQETALILYTTMAINAYLWAEMVMYFFRLIQTGSHKEAASKSFAWMRNAASEDDEARVDER